MSSCDRVLVLFAVLALGLLAAGTACAASASLEQVRNGPADATTTPIPIWESGNAGASNSHYLESHSIAYRAVLDKLPTDGTVIELIVGYDVKRSDSYALDYLTHFQRLLPHVLFGHTQPEVFDPLAGVSGVSATVSTAPIPIPTVNLVVDPDGADPEPAMPQPSTSMAALPDSQRVMTLYGGTLIDVSYVTQADVALATGSSESQVRVRFTADSPSAVLAWGGHIACRWDWGFNADGSPRSAGGISGSSYHMRLVTWNLGNLGNQDRSLSTDAVYPMPRCGISNLGPFCAGSTHTHTAPGGMETYAWSLIDNTCGAEIVGSAADTSVEVRSATGGSYTIVLTTGSFGFTRQCQATVVVNAPAAADAGADPVVCASAPAVRLAGVVTGGSGSWSGGAGSFVPGRSDMNATYTPTAAEIAAGGVTLVLTSTPAGPCPPSSDTLRIVIRPVATASAGPDQTVCASAPAVRLAGTVGGAASSGTWSGGAGSFVPDASTLNATYTPSAAEIAAGSVTLTLTTNDPDGPCSPVNDVIVITIDPAATVNAGPDQRACAGAPQVTLAGSVGGAASGGTWSGGTGSFSPGRSALGAAYTPSAAEIAAGGVTLTLTTNDPPGPCGAVSDDVRITVSPSATANAGPDQTVCASAPAVRLAGTVGGAASRGTWSGGAGTFSPDRSALDATYTPSAAEVAARSVTLTLTTDDPEGPCPAASDWMVITIDPAATVNAGADQRVCASAPQVTLAGVVDGGASGGVWSGGGGSFDPGPAALHAVYTPSAAEIAAGGVTLTLTTNDPAGPCPAVSDAMRIVIDPVTVVSAGPDQAVCSSSPQVQLHGSVSGTVSSGSWRGGMGVFTPGRTSLNATYTPSAAEISAKTVVLMLVSDTPSGPCPPASDMMTISILPAATVEAGPDQIVCLTSPQVQLAGSFGGGASGCAWSGGSGTFTPGRTVPNPTYTLSAAEIAAGGVTLTLTTNDPNGPCPAASDPMHITVDALAVTVPDRVVCTGISPVTLCASVAHGTSPYRYLWSTGATTSCISVADTLRYAVTVTDAKGCQASGSGAFRQRDCQGQLVHTSTTCDTWMAGTGEDFPPTGVSYVLRDNVITSIAPGVFFYFTKVTAPATDFSIYILQIKDNPDFPFCPVQNGDQVTLYDANCASIGSGHEYAPGQAVVDVHGATVGQVFIVSVKYSLKALVGSTLDPAHGVHYTFRTNVLDKIVDADPDGLQIGTPLVLGVGDRAPAGVSFDLYRPIPNPFSHGMQMAYAVPSSGEQVTVGVYDLAGRLVRTLASDVQEPGTHLVVWNGRDEQGVRMRSGVYFVHVRIGSQSRIVRVTFLK